MARELAPVGLRSSPCKDQLVFSGTTRLPVQGPPAYEPGAFCGSWLACDAGNSVQQINRGDAIAGKPAPTFARLHPGNRARPPRAGNRAFLCGEGACSRWAAQQPL
ncbi:hypothetical protein CXQ82_20115 [Pseudomonas sp. S09G 359]|nr:hypothetical protein CXQ82_20115 [Pseudomonas sp. S09G 359]